MTQAFKTALIVVLFSAAGFALQLDRMGATYLDGEAVPADNDALYHARRILDTAADPARFYEFDARIHAPAGSLIVWPWGYDYTMAQLVRFATATGIADEPLAALIYIPPLAVILSIALVTLLARNLSLSTLGTALLAGTIAVSPLTRMMHGLGCVDHHFAEYIFILGFLAAATGWMRNPGSLPWAVATGLVLGLAPSMHTLLFILQVPLLVTLVLLWLRNANPAGTAAAAFAATLLAATLAIAVFSEPFRAGYFQHFYLSWFHLYVACCTALVVLMLAHRPCSRRTIAINLSAAVLLGIPLLSQIAQAAGYLGNSERVLTDIREAAPAWNLLRENPGQGIAFYSGLILAAPVIVGGCILAMFRAKRAEVLLVCVVSALSVPLLLAQFRFHYYGSIGLALPPLLLADHWWRSANRKFAVALLLAFVLAWIPSLRMSLRADTTVARDPYFVLTRLAMPALAAACKADPGIVLAKNNDGHVIRYYTDCSVIANNFLLTPQQTNAFNQVAQLYRMQPDAVARSKIPIKYVVVRARGALAGRPDGKGYMLVGREDAQVVSDPLTDALLWGDVSAAPAPFKLIAEIPAPGRDYPYARIWKIIRTDTPAR